MRPPENQNPALLAEGSDRAKETDQATNQISSTLSQPAPTLQAFSLQRLEAEVLWAKHHKRRFQVVRKRPFARTRR